MKKYLRLTALLLFVSLVSACGTSKFFSVVESGDFQEVNRLLVAGADVNSRNYRDATPLFSASLSGSRDVAELLIKHGADIHATDRAGFTPLHAASYKNRIELAELLISKGERERQRKSWLDAATQSDRKICRFGNGVTPYISNRDRNYYNDGHCQSTACKRSRSQCRGFVWGNTADFCGGFGSKSLG